MSTLDLNIPQSNFLLSKTPFKAYVAGYRGGKTFVGCASMLINAIKYKGIKQAYYAPTFGMIGDIFYPTIAEVAEIMGGGLRVEVFTSRKEVEIYHGKKFLSLVRCRSMDNPARLVGYETAHSMIDEMDLLPQKKADVVFKKIVARMSQKVPGREINTIDVCTTPEGFGWCYKTFVESKPDPTYYGLYRASTLDNEKNLPDDYIPKLRASYPENLCRAYLDGEFVNLTSGSVYTSFSRENNVIPPIVLNQGEPIHIGVDFNVGINAAVFHVVRDSKIIAFDYAIENADTPALINLVRQRFPGRQIIAYPDASGQYARSTTNASLTDVGLLKAAGWQIRAGKANPDIRNRVNTLNKAFEDKTYLVTSNCTKVIENLERQAYDDDGKPDKKAGFDHTNDGMGYLAWQLAPIRAVRPNQQGAVRL